MSLKYFLFLLKSLPFFLIKRVPYNLIHFYRNSITEINNRLQVTLHFKLFFVPLYGDSHWALRIAGVLYRSFRILWGALFLSLFTIFFVFVFLAVIFSPLIVLYNSISYFVLFVTGVFISYILYYYFNPFHVLDYKSSYSYFDLYKCSSLGIRHLLSNYKKGRLSPNSFKKIAPYFETNPEKIYSYVSSQSYNEKEICREVLRFCKEARYRHVSKEVFVSSLLSLSSDFKEFLNLQNLHENSLKHYLITVRKDFRVNQAQIWDADYESSYSFPYNVAKLDKNTPVLNKFSVDLSSQLEHLAISYLKSFKGYKLNLINTLTKGSKKVMLLGESGTGKTSLIKDFYFDIKKGNVPSDLQFNRILSLDLSSIVSLGNKGPETLSEALKEFSNLQNTILFLDNLHILYSLEGLDYMSILLPYIENPKLKIISTSDYETYVSKVKKNSGFDSSFDKIKMEELEGKELLDFLILLNWDLNPKLTIPAINFLSYSSSQVLFDQHNPKKSISIIKHAENFGVDTLITKSHIDSVVKDLTGISLGEVSQKESDNLLHLEEDIKSEVVGQDKAVKEVVDSLIRSRSIQRDSNKPIASFLFAGPTGVGKTELAKSVARNYFGGEQNIIRLDMSEYQTKESIGRLLGSGDGGNYRSLTERVKEKPFTLLLLDEIEKASKDVHMLFLQVLDDGRLTDNSGTTISFKNIIIIATTNAGTEKVIEDFSGGKGYDRVRKNFMQNIKKYFPPEFLNRFTEIVLFEPLNDPTLNKVLEIKLKDLKERVYKTKKVNISLTPKVKEAVLDSSYSKEWGARSLERNLEKVIVTAVSKALIKGDINPGDTVEIDMSFLAKYSSF